MPQYEFRCYFCGHTRTGLFCSFEDAETIGLNCDHPDCMYGTKMDRQVSPPSFVITGFNAANGYSGEKS